MANSVCCWKRPEQWSEWSEWLTAGLHARNRRRLPILLMGMLFASGRRTVTSWLRTLLLSKRLLLVIDDSPTKRYGPIGGVLRVVLVQKDHGCFALFCTDPNAGVQEILEAFADRATIEQDFHDVKEVGGAGQQQVRNIWTNLAAYNLNLSRGRSPQKSFNGPKPSWHWPPDLNQFSESAG